MRFIDLFCGIGGFRLGLKRTNQKSWSTKQISRRSDIRSDRNSTDNASTGRQQGQGQLTYRCVWSCDIDKYARQIYEKNFGEEPAGDITKIPAESIPDHDLLCAGFPCQAFSVAGKRKGFQDTRGTLFFDIARILSHKRPPYFLLENVEGLLSDDDGKTFQTILGVLTDIGYLLQSEVLNSKNYSVPQNRRRVFIVGHLRGKGRPEIFPVAESTKQNQQVDSGNQQIASAIQARDWRGQGKQLDNLMIQVIQDRRQSGEFRIKDKPCVTANYGLGGGNVPMVAQALQTDGFLRQGVSWGTDKPQSARNIRHFTPVECERLQGFPDNWTQGVSDTQRYKLLGNAVTVNVIEFLGKRLAQEVMKL